MGKLSALFGFGESRDKAQDDRLAAIETRLGAVESRPAGGVDPTVLERLSVLEQRTVVDASARHDLTELDARTTVVEATVQALRNREVADGAARTAAANAAAAAASATSAVGNLTAALDRISTRLGVIEAEFADLPSGDPGTPDEGGITLPEVKP